MTEQEVHENLKHRMYIFTMLSTQTEEWAITLLHSPIVKHEFKMILNNYIQACNRLRRFIGKFIDMEKAEDVSEVMSIVLELCTPENREEFLSYIMAYKNGEIKKLSDEELKKLEDGGQN